MTLEGLLTWYFELLDAGESIACSWVTASPCRCRGERIPGMTCPACEGSGTVFELRQGNSDRRSDITETMAKRCDVGVLLETLSPIERAVVRTRFLSLLSEGEEMRSARSRTARAREIDKRDGAKLNGREVCDLRMSAKTARSRSAEALTVRRRIERSAVYRRAMSKLTGKLTT